MRKETIISLLAVVLIAGCVQGQIPFISTTTTMVAGAGLTITEFTADPSELYGGSTSRIQMEVQNLGGDSVPQAEALVMLVGSALLLDELTDGSDTYWTNPDEDDFVSFSKDMDPADPVREKEADVERLKWSLEAPSVDTGQIRNDIFIGRVYYDYSTKVSGTIWVYNQAEADAAKAAGRALNPPTFSSTSGPVAVNLRLSPDPVVLTEEDKTLTLTIKLSSVGGGTLYEAGVIDYDALNPGPGTVQILEDELNLVALDIASPGMTLEDVTCETELQELVSGKDTTIFCDLTVNSLPTTFQGYPVTVTADYGYFTERTASVTVSGR